MVEDCYSICLKLVQRIPEKTAFTGIIIMIDWIITSAIIGEKSKPAK
tara:strand:+ start:589 stop:729 length:141 start_codon:yes stop_codon:yes gene_type:complete